MATKTNPGVRSVATEPVTIKEAAAPTGVATPHPALDPGRTGTATQLAIEMNVPAGQSGVPYSGEALGVTPTSPKPEAQPKYSGETLMTTSQEAALRAHDEKNRGIK